MAHLMAYVQNIAGQQKRLMEEMDRIRASLPQQDMRVSKSKTIEIAVPTSPPIDQAALEAFGQKLSKDIMKDIMNEVTVLLRSEIRSSETSSQTRLEQFVSKTLKDRLELAMQPMRSQLNDLDLRMEELKEDVGNTHQPLPMVQNSTARLDIDSLPTSSIDIEALTKNILGSGCSVSGSSDDMTSSGTNKTEDINFSQNKKKILRKTLPSKA